MTAQRWLESRFAFSAIVIIALCSGITLRWAALDTGFFSDDFDHWAMQQGTYPVARSQLDRFNFSDGSAAENHLLMQSGHFPWWTYPSVHLSMWRPLSSALMSIDFAWFGNDARLFHLHSSLWWAILVLMAGAVFWRVLPKPSAAIATLFFAVEEGHGLPLAWLANRSTLVASAFGFAALLLHLVWRERGALSARLGFVVCSVFALAAGEYAFTPFAYLAAFELLRPGASARGLATALWPVALAAAVYLSIRQLLGYGIDGSGFYISPSATPLAFLSALSWRIPVLVADLMFGISADWYIQGTPWREQLLELNLFSPSVWYGLPSWHAWQVSLGVVALVMLAALAWFAPRWIGESRGRAVRWLAVGALLALVPVAGSMVSARLLGAASLGFAGCIGELVTASVCGLVRSRSKLGRVLAAVSCGLAIWVHGYRAAVRSHDDANWFSYHAHFERELIRDADVDDRLAPSQEWFVFAAQDMMTRFYLPYLRAFDGRPRPRSTWLLSGAPQAHDLLRVSDRAFELIVLTSDVALMATGSNYRPTDAPLAAGDEVKLDGLHARVLTARDGQPVRTLFTLDAPLEDPRYVFLQPTDRGLRRVHLPAIGDRIRIPRPLYPDRPALDALRAERERSLRAGQGGALPPVYFQLFPSNR